MGVCGVWSQCLYVAFVYVVANAYLNVIEHILYVFYRTASYIKCLFSIKIIITLETLISAF